MISKAVELAIAAGLQPEDLRGLRDETLLGLLETRYGNQPGIRHILACFGSRRLYRPCLVLAADIGASRQREIVGKFHAGQHEREELEAAIASACGLAPYQVIVYCPSIGMSLPEAEVAVRQPGGRILPLSESNNEEIRVLKEKHKALWKFVVLLDRSAVECGGRAAMVAAGLLP
jgi:HD superfamily phosphohydrolase